ncbi:ATP-binding protein [Kitasatospora sp. NPDC052896]|uniref:ATP-binding protein n=1 Tax=Kitasatospora sp. NPDC052896 TaxID=3364061 RepID=UPI0037C58FE3
MGQPSGDFGQESLRVRAGQLVSGRYLVTVGGPDGSDVQLCPPEHWPAPQRRQPNAQRPGARPGNRAAVGPLALGADAADLPLLDREAEVAQLLGMLAEGRSIRLVGEQGSGRSALLAAVAEGAGELAPDGVVQLCGHRRTADDLLQDLFAATHRAPGFRPDRDQLRTLLAPVGAIVLIDELGSDGAELEELLAAAPECAFLVSVAAGSGGVLPTGSRLEDYLVGGLSRAACLALTARLAGRVLDEAERSWAVDLWFESEGLPLRFVQAAALLRQRDLAVDALVAAEEDRRGVFGGAGEGEDDEDGPADPAVREAELRATLPLPSVAESAAPAIQLAQGLGEPAQAVLRLALAFGGECPTAPHLPALIEVDQGESALRELADRGLAEPIGGHHRLTAGATELLTAGWAEREAPDGTSATPAAATAGAARHFSWWVGHGSVSTEQIAAEAEVVIGALHADRAAGRTGAMLRLARSAAPAFALALRWGAWQEVLELGLAVAREDGQSRDEAWFQHELGVLRVVQGRREEARAALEAATALRGALGEARGVAATRRLLNLLADEERPPAAPEAGLPASRRPVIRALAERSLQSAKVPVRVLRGWSRQHLLAAGAGLLAIGVLGTAVGIAAVAGTGGSGGTGGGVRSVPSGGTGTSGGLTLGGDAGATAPSTASATPTGSASATATGGAGGVGPVTDPTMAVGASAGATASPTRVPGAGRTGSPSATPGSSGGVTGGPATPSAPGPSTPAPSTSTSSNPASPPPVSPTPPTKSPTPSPSQVSPSLPSSPSAGGSSGPSPKLE